MKAIDDQFATYTLLSKEFAARGYKIKEDTLGSTRMIHFTSPQGQTWLTSISRISYPLGTPFVGKVSTGKSLAYEFAEKNGMPVPDTYCVNGEQPVDDERLISMLKAHGSLIVKPENSSLSNGLTVNLTDVDEIKKAINDAKPFSSSTLVQQQVYGEELRFVVMQGAVKAVMLRETAQVVGDGKSSVMELIEKENKARKQLVFPYITYPQLTANIIKEEYLQDTSVPQDGEVVKLGHSTMIRGGASIYNVIDSIHPSYIARIETLIRALGAGFIVVDLFVRDYTQPMSDTNAYFIEFNTAPVLKLFYGCRDGKMFDVIPELVSYIDKRIHV